MIYLRKKTRIIKMDTKQFNREFRGLVKACKIADIPKFTMDFINSGGTPAVGTIGSIYEHMVGINTSLKQITGIVEGFILATDYDNYTESTFTSLIKIFCKSEWYSKERINTYLHEMVKRELRIKIRTLAPVFRIIAENNDMDWLMNLYSFSKTHQVPLTMVEYLNILNYVYGERKNYGDYFIYSIWKDIAKDVETVNSNLAPLLNSLLSELTPNLEEINFDMSKKVGKALTDKIEDYVHHIMSWRGHGKAFSSFLGNIKSITSANYNVVIDGANLGFFNQKTNSGKILNFEQIKIMVDYLISLKMRPILVLHSRHFQKLSAKNNTIVETMGCKIVKTPNAMDDDWTWLHLSLSKKNCYLLTNDEMRNHLFYMGLDETFANWKQCRVINYNITDSNVVLDEGEKRLVKVHNILNEGKTYIPFKEPFRSVVTWKCYSIS